MAHEIICTSELTNFTNFQSFIFVWIKIIKCVRLKSRKHVLLLKSYWDTVSHVEITVKYDKECVDGVKIVWWGFNQ